jgi:menaquinone-dependent protoporphyrinogen IX oxidase
MHDVDNGYGDLQQPAGSYGAAVLGTASYPDLMKKAPAPSIKQVPPAAAPLSPQKIANDMVATMAAIYKKKYVARGLTFGPLVGKKIPVKLVADADMKAELAKQAERIGNDIIHAMLKFNPQKVLDDLTKYYDALGEPLPDRLKKVDENTKLNKEENGVLFGAMQGVLLAQVTKDADQTLGFFALGKKPKDLGTMFVRAEFAKTDNALSELAGTVAHEMAHAYAGTRWRDFMRVMFAVGMMRTGELEEGMATFFEAEVTEEWLKTQPEGTKAPTPGYTDMPEVADSRDTFLADVDRDPALYAFFGGWVDFKDINHPQDTIVVGKPTKKAWKWPWQS